MKKMPITNDPIPFNHGQSSIVYKGISLEKNKKITNILNKGWGLKDITKLSTNKMAVNFYSSIYKVTIQKNDYILKVSNINNIKRQKIISKCINYLYQSNFPVPKIIKTTSGKYFFSYNNTS